MLASGFEEQKTEMCEVMETGEPASKCVQGAVEGTSGTEEAWPEREDAGKSGRVKTDACQWDSVRSSRRGPAGCHELGLRLSLLGWAMERGCCVHRTPFWKLGCEERSTAEGWDGRDLAERLKSMRSFAKPRDGRRVHGISV